MWNKCVFFERFQAVMVQTLVSVVTLNVMYNRYRKVKLFIRLRFSLNKRTYRVYESCDLAEKVSI